MNIYQSKRLEKVRNPWVKAQRREGEKGKKGM